MVILKRRLTEEEASLQRAERSCDAPVDINSGLDGILGGICWSNCSERC